jgi:hypothetical protein
MYDTTNITVDIGTVINESGNIIVDAANTNSELENTIFDVKDDINIKGSLNAFEPNFINGVYKCPTCYKSYTRDSNLKKHLKNCKKIKSPLECSFCHQIFTASSNLSRHKKICVKTTKMATPTAKPTETNSIHLNNFGKENISHIKENELIHCIKSISNNGFMDLINKIYNFPENRTIKNHSKKQHLVKIHKDGKWIYEDTTFAINAMIEKTSILMHRKYYETDSILKKLDEEKEMYIIKTIIQLFSKVRSSSEYKNIHRQIYIYILNLSKEEDEEDT